MFAFVFYAVFARVCVCEVFLDLTQPTVRTDSLSVLHSTWPKHCPQWSVKKPALFLFFLKRQKSPKGLAHFWTEQFAKVTTIRSTKGAEAAGRSRWCGPLSLSPSLYKQACFLQIQTEDGIQRDHLWGFFFPAWLFKRDGKVSTFKIRCIINHLLSHKALKLEGLWSLRPGCPWHQHSVNCNLA